MNRRLDSYESGRSKAFIDAYDSDFFYITYESQYIDVAVKLEQSRSRGFIGNVHAMFYKHVFFFSYLDLTRPDLTSCADHDRALPICGSPITARLRLVRIEPPTDYGRLR